jgi:hypothetical protein
LKERFSSVPEFPLQTTTFGPVVRNAGTWPFAGNGKLVVRSGWLDAPLGSRRSRAARSRRGRRKRLVICASLRTCPWARGTPG